MLWFVIHQREYRLGGLGADTQVAINGECFYHRPEYIEMVG